MPSLFGMVILSNLSLGLFFLAASRLISLVFPFLARRTRTASYSSLVLCTKAGFNFSDNSEVATPTALEASLT